MLDALRATRSVRDDSRPVIALEIFSDARPDLAGRYESRDGSSRIPASFAKVCEENAWDVDDTWRRLNGGEHGAWFEKTTPDANGSYVYRNAADGKWWIDGPDGLGVYIAPGPPRAPRARPFAGRRSTEGRTRRRSLRFAGRNSDAKDARDSDVIRTRRASLCCDTHETRVTLL